MEVFVLIYIVLAVVFWVTFMYIHSRRNTLTPGDVGNSLITFGVLWGVFVPVVVFMWFFGNVGIHIACFFNRLNKKKG